MKAVATHLDYYSWIDEPIDLGMMRFKYSTGSYTYVAEFVKYIETWFDEPVIHSRRVTLYYNKLKRLLD